mgnify:CR=1 FL=1|jgi:hypothetical protein
MSNTRKKQEGKTAKELAAEKKAQNKALFAKLQKEAKDQAKEKKAEAAKRKPTGKQVKVKSISNLSGKYGLPYSDGQVFEISENQAKELIKNKDAEAVAEKAPEDPKE